MSSGVQESSSEKELQEVIGLRYRVLRKPWSQPYETSRDSLEETSVNAYIRNDEGLVVACGRLQVNEGNTGQIRYMAVDENHRGKGLGRDVLVYLEKRAKEIGLALIELQARENAVSFYEGAGYKVKERSFLLWGKIQHFLMQKRLT